MSHSLVRCVLAAHLAAAQGASDLEGCGWIAIQRMTRVFPRGSRGQTAAEAMTTDEPKDYYAEQPTKGAASKMCLTAVEAAQYLRISRNTLYDAAGRGDSHIAA